MTYDDDIIMRIAVRLGLVDENGKIDLFKTSLWTLMGIGLVVVLAIPWTEPMTTSPFMNDILSICGAIIPLVIVIGVFLWVFPRGWMR